MKKNNLKTKVASIFVWLNLLVLYPSMLFVLFEPYHKLLIVLPIISAIFIFKLTKENLPFLISSLISISYIIIYPVINDEIMVGDSMTILLRMIGILFILINIISFNPKKTINIFVNVILAIAIANLVSSVLTVVFNIEGVNEFVHNGRVMKLYLFTISAVDIPFSNFRIIKGAGVFDEPGALSFFIFSAIILNRLAEVRSSKKEVVLTICGLATLSLAFIILIFLYTIFSNGKVNINRLIVSGLTVILLFSVIKIANETIYDNVYKLTIGRLLSSDVNEDGRSVTNTRGHINTISLELLSNNLLFGFGVQHSLDYSDDYGLASILATFAARGLLGGGLFLSPLICMSLYPFIHVKKVDFAKLSVAIVVVVLFLLSFSQRPFLSLPLNFITIYLVYISLINYLSGWKYENNNAESRISS
ncbi:TPA: hypothetical protein I7263_11000 [Vibrio parahaemolyticus]|nr:hypothetical protein [Vibrio parahaemolyticus]